MLPAAEALGVDISRVAMAVAWGDAWTNLLQPFRALQMVGIASAKHGTLWDSASCSC